MNMDQATSIINLWRSTEIIDHRGIKRKGWMPIEMFNEFESMIRAALKTYYGRPHQVFYRGPRKSNNCASYTTPSMTRRCDAKFVTF